MNMWIASSIVQDMESIYKGNNFTVTQTHTHSQNYAKYKIGCFRQQLFYITAATIINNCHSIYNGAFHIHAVIDRFITLAINNIK